MNEDPATQLAGISKKDLALVERLPAWGKTLRVRSVSAPMIHVVDSGVAARLMRVGPDRLVRLDSTAPTEFGNLLEAFVVGELAQAGLLARRAGDDGALAHSRRW